MEEQRTHEDTYPLIHTEGEDRSEELSGHRYTAFPAKKSY